MPKKDPSAIRTLCRRCKNWWTPPEGSFTAYCLECREDSKETLDDEGEVGYLLSRIRRLGWFVAVHNDYTLKGDRWTFYLFTKGNIAVRGEAKTDIAALRGVWDQIQEY